jgi:hypothetical protein
MNSGMDNARFRASSDAVHNNVEDQSVLVHMGTNKIFELNRTGARFWELLCAGHALSEIRQIMLQEFDVAEAELNRETKDLLTALENEGLVVRTS